MDKISPDVRSRNMAAIRSKNTKPELFVRKALYQKGYRYRIHYKLAGKPDVVFIGRRLAIFVNGCFWHGHGCALSHAPKTNSEFWDSKIRRNIERDAESILKLETDGWRSLTIWECQIKNEPDDTISSIEAALRL